MSFQLFLKSLFTEPSFKPGERVNHISGGSIKRTDGCVVAKTESGVLVEWPRGGSSMIPATELSVIE
ncbi:hypothetical protein [Rhodoferax sp.]|uniref:hypothetical protein n=1 Tax=Rhodoferax sp. TaxID=50421 RepID=UPI00284F6925|nr:hypothetical protein [Rhodoferax sp.]MDR3369423.1 hypothetical protein [Rhodoferax sp.]